MFAPLPVETVLQNRYRIVGALGKGAMGAVYLAHDNRLKCEVAVKQTMLLGEDDFLHAFEREALLLANLSHPALPRVSDFFDERDGYFLVMELIRGDNLEEARNKRGGRLPFTEVRQIAFQLLDVLDYLHTQETPVIHKDIKPANLKLTQRGQLKLLDFGLAKGSAGLMTTHKSSILKGGTPAYEPPEQSEGKSTDPRSDIYSAAATLYHLVTGIKPPHSLTERALALALGKPDPLQLISELNAEVPRDFALILHQGLALAPENRPLSADKMRQLLQQPEIDTEATVLQKKTTSPQRKTETKPIEKKTTDPKRGEQQAPRKIETANKSLVNEPPKIDKQEKANEPKPTTRKTGIRNVNPNAKKSTPQEIAAAKKAFEDEERKRLAEQKQAEEHRAFEEAQRRKAEEYWVKAAEKRAYEQERLEAKKRLEQRAEEEKRRQESSQKSNLPILPPERRPSFWDKITDWVDDQKTGGYFTRGMRLAEKKDFVGAIECYTKAIELCPTHEYAYNNRGQVYLETNRAEDALKDFNKALEINPQNPEAHFNKAQYYFKKQIYNLAITEFTAAIELKFNLAASYNNRGICRHRTLKPRDAFNDYSAAIEHDRNYYLAYYNRGLVSFELGNYQQALRDYNKAIELNPNYADAYKNRARALQKIGEHAAAQADFQKAAELERKG